MSTIRELRFFLLKSADVTQEIPIRTNDLALKFQVPESHVRDELIGLYEQGHITLSTWDGNYRKPLNEWPSADVFFTSAWQGGDRWIKLRSKGKELLDEIMSQSAQQAGGELEDDHPRPKIGFV